MEVSGPTSVLRFALTLNQAEQIIYCVSGRMQSSESFDDSISDASVRPMISRYSRQMLVPELNGTEGQKVLQGSSVLVVGAGGIGVTAIMYLAGAGVGKIGIVDFDIVDVSNLHRQIIYTMDQVGTKKSECAAQRARALNPSITIEAIDAKVNCSNAIELISPYDVIVDATDNFQVRYVLNDACVLERKPLVSGAAVGLEGQATVFAPALCGTGCYRCVHPCISPAEACRSCADAGVLGPVPGMIGCLLSIEAIKVLRLSHQSEAVQLTGSMQPLLGRQIYYDARMSSFHEFKLPRRSDKCNICGSAPTITSLQDSKLWLEESLRSSSQRPKLMDAKYEVTAIQYNEFLSRNTPHILLDVRSAVQYSIVNLKARCDEHSGRCLSIPWKEISNKSKINTVQSLLQSVLDDIKSDDCVDIFVLCRRGNDSISVTNFLISEWCEPTSAGGCDGLTMWGRVVRIRNIRGGLLEWSKSVDTNFPMY